MKLIMSMMILVTFNVFATNFDIGGIVNLTNGGSYVAQDGTQINCSTSGTISEKHFCYCDSSNVLWLTRNSGDIKLANFGFSTTSCLASIENRPDCKNI